MLDNTSTLKCDASRSTAAPRYTYHVPLLTPSPQLCTRGVEPIHPDPIRQNVTERDTVQCEVRGVRPIAVAFETTSPLHVRVFVPL